jgi:glycolate oxidase FAD binding subunit
LLTPSSESELSEIVGAATAPLLIQGNGTKSGMLRPVQAAETLSTSALTGMTLYAPKELVMSARAGTPLAEIEALLAANGQMLIAEPSHLFGETQTIGGITAANVSGPRRIMGGAMRDHVLGVRAVNGSGEVLNFGGRVLKNVTGLDVAKLLTGSYGTLAVMTEVTFKVLPAPESTGTVVIPDLDAEAAVRVMSAGLGSPFSVSGAAYLPDERAAYLRIEEFETSVKYRCEKLALQFPRAEILGDDASKTLWRDIRDCKMLSYGDTLWRISVQPSLGPAILHAGESLGFEGIMDWGGGLVWLSGPSDEKCSAALCHEIKKAGGVWWLMRGPDALRNTVEVLPPEAPALAQLRARVQHAFDPRGLFNPLKLRAA